MNEVNYAEQMKSYLGVTFVRAVAMTRQEYNTLRGWEVPQDENPSDNGYLVEYVNSPASNHPSFSGHIAWLPKDNFEQIYTLANDEKSIYFGLATEDGVVIGSGKTPAQAKERAEYYKDFMRIPATFDFGTAIYLLKSGERVKRSGWNGKGMFLFLVKGEALTQAVEERYGDPEKQGVHKVLDQIYMHTVQGDLVAWLANQTDVLAEDWELV